MSADLDLFVTCPRGLEPLLVEELGALGAATAAERAGGVACRGPLALAYRACLWSRLASRVLLPLTRQPLSGPDDLYAAGRSVAWHEQFAVGSSFSIEVAGRSPAVAHTHFAALRVKDAVVDHFREHQGRRPDVQPKSPDLRLHVHLDRDAVTLSLDLSGESLHRRGYRAGTGEAPLKENLACALLLRAGWPRIAAAGGALLDPMCGSGTLLIEGAMMAADRAPGLHRRQYGFEHWRAHDAGCWAGLLDEARARAADGLRRLPPLVGRDLDERVLGWARTNAQRAGLGTAITWQAGDLMQADPPAAPPGLLLTNPPYGERLAAEGEVIKLYSLLGELLRTRFGGWRAAVLTARPDLAPRIGLRADTIHAFYNGDLPCKLLQFAVPEAPAEAAARTPGPFANRLAKNRRHLGKWARRTGVSCYRVYDGDLPDYAVAVDQYPSVDGAIHLHVQEYTAPGEIDPVRAEKRLREALADLRSAYDLPASQLHLKRRSVQAGMRQYEKQGEQQRVVEVDEHGCRLLVNLDDYLDTGLFLDHRPLRRRLQHEARDRRVLNLFCYTGAATVHAAVGGAAQTVSVDLSNTYLRWAQRNLGANGIDASFELGRDTERPAMSAGGPWNRRAARSAGTARGRPVSAHVLVRDDCMAWLQRQADAGAGGFDLIFCDPPTFSNSARVEGVFDVQRDHAELIRRCVALLAPDGVLYFSTNRRRFRLDGEALAGLSCRDITAQSLDEDFRRPRPAHRAWRIGRGPETN